MGFGVLRDLKHHLHSCLPDWRKPAAKAVTMESLLLWVWAVRALPAKEGAKIANCGSLPPGRGKKQRSSAKKEGLGLSARTYTLHINTRT